MSDYKYVEFDKNKKKELGLDDVISISPSRIKTLISCSWIYFCKYVLKLPDTSNDGAKRGIICHLILELLLRKKHHKYIKDIVDNGFKNPVIQRLVKKHMKKLDLNLFSHKFEDNLKMMEEMTIVGLTNDFLMESDGDIPKHSEMPFNFACYKKGKPLYIVNGIIDKYSESDTTINIKDYKTSVSKFTEKELRKDYQTFIYSLFFDRVKNKQSKFDFIFLRYKDDPILKNEATKEDLSNLEVELAQISKKMSNFGPKDAVSDFAADQGYPSSDEGFKGRLICGRAKYKGEKKKDGSDMWHCAFKFPMLYYVEQDSKGKIVQSSFDPIENKKDPKNKVIKMSYKGCPKFNKY